MFQPLYVLRDHRAAVQGVSFLRQGRLLLSGDAEGVLKVWDLQERRACFSRQIHDSNSGVLQLHALEGPQGPLVLSQGRNGSASCWQLQGDGSLATTPVQDIQTAAFSFCRCSMLAPAVAGGAASSSSSSEQASRPTGESPSTGSRQQQGPSNASAEGDAGGSGSRVPEEARGCRSSGSSSGSSAVLLAMPCHDGSSLGIWQLGRGCSSQPVLQLHQQRKEAAGAVHGMCMAVQLTREPATGAVWAWVGYEDGMVAAWDLRQPKGPAAELRVHEEPLMAIAVDLPRGRGASAAADSHLALFEFDLASGVLAAAGQLPLSKAGVADLALRWDGKVLASAGWDAKVRLWSMRQQKLLAVGQYHSKQVTCVRYSQEQQLLASGSQDCHIAVWPAKPAASSQQ